MLFSKKLISSNCATEPDLFSDISSHNRIVIENADSLFIDAAKYIVSKNKGSIGYIQRNFNIGFNRSDRIMNQLEQAGIVGKECGVKPRDVLLSNSELEHLLNNITLLYEQKDEQNSKSDALLLSQMECELVDGYHFEEYCAYLLKNNGFSKVIITPKSGDHGIDILAEKDDISYAIQCKYYSSKIGNFAIQQANAGRIIYKKDIAVVLTNQFFTEQAKEEACILNVKLWDKNKLNFFIKNVQTKGECL